MKKSTITLIALLSVLSLSACGRESDNNDDFKSPSATTTSSTATTSVSYTTESTSTAAATTTEAAQTTAPAADYSPADLSGEWIQRDTGNILTVSDDGTFSLKYVYGGSRSGKIKIESEEHPDGSFTYWYSFYGENDDLWAGFVCPEKPFNEIYSEDDGGMTFVRNDSSTPLAPTVPEAKDLRDALAFADRLMCGIGIATDNNTEYMTDDGTVYHKSVDNIYKTTDDVRNYLYSCMTEQFISSSYDYLLGTETPKCIDVDGELYIEYRPIGGKYSFYAEDPTVTRTDGGYSINIRNNDYGADNTVVLDVVKEDGRWKINGVHSS